LCNGTVSASLSGSGDLSTGAKAGIGVGAAVGGSIIVACIATAIVYCRRRRRKKAGQAKVPTDTDIVDKRPVDVEEKDIQEVESPPELHGREADVVGTHPEMDGGQGRVAEVHGEHSNFSSPLSAELESRTFHAELPP
jgi:hypothetical protein